MVNPPGARYLASPVFLRDGRPQHWRTPRAGEKLEVEVRIEPFDIPATAGRGLRVVRGERLILLDERVLLWDRIVALGRALSELENETIYGAF